MWTLKIREKKVKELIASSDNVNVIRNLLSQGMLIKAVKEYYLFYKPSIEPFSQIKKD